MKIQCLLQRENGTKVEMDGVTYHFKPEGDDGPHVCEVSNDKHAKKLLAIREAYVSAEDVDQPEQGNGIDDELLLTDQQIEEIAITCHNANRAHCKAINDPISPDWSQLPVEIRESVINGVEFVLNGLAAGEKVTAEDSHQNWLHTMVDNGWSVGSKKDPVKKQHPNMVPFDELSPDQQEKDILFIKTIKQKLAVMAGEIDESRADIPELTPGDDDLDVFEETNNDFLEPSATEFEDEGNETDDSTGDAQASADADEGDGGTAGDATGTVAEETDQTMEDVLNTLEKSGASKDDIITFTNDNAEHFPGVKLTKTMKEETMLKHLRDTWAASQQPEMGDDEGSAGENAEGQAA